MRAPKPQCPKCRKINLVLSLEQYQPVRVVCGHGCGWSRRVPADEIAWLAVETCNSWRDDCNCFICINKRNLQIRRVNYKRVVV